MLFSYDSAFKEAQRLNKDRTHSFATLKKKWYGWIVVDHAPKIIRLVNTIDHHLVSEYLETQSPQPIEGLP
jgi:hypothetical protein